MKEEKEKLTWHFFRLILCFRHVGCCVQVSFKYLSTVCGFIFVTDASTMRCPTTKKLLFQWKIRQRLLKVCPRLPKTNSHFKKKKKINRIDAITGLVPSFTSRDCDPPFSPYPLPQVPPHSLLFNSSFILFLSIVNNEAHF